MIKHLLSLAAIVLTWVTFIPYLRSIYRGETQPHVFSWVIWGLTTFVVFLAQLAAHGGVGSWPIGVSGVITGYVAFLAFLKKGDTQITRGDWVFFGAALSALPLWALTANPLWAVVILTTVDLLGFGPTVRKVYFQPNSEKISFFALFVLRNGLVLLALEQYSVATVLFPAAVGLGCLGVIGVMIWRRRILV